MSRVGGYTAFNTDYRNIYEKTETAKKFPDKKTVEKENAADRMAAKQPELSQGAKDLLNEMQKKYSDMDFFVADYSSDEEAQGYLSRGSKDYSVLIEPELLEKMAADGSVKEKYLGVIDDAKNKISEVKDEIDKMDDGEDGGKKADIKSLGFAVKEDGSAFFFAELEKSSSDQKMRIEKTREKKQAEKKDNAKAEKAEKMEELREKKTKRTLVNGDSIEELVENIRSFDWSYVSEKVSPGAGGKIDVRM